MANIKIPSAQKTGACGNESSPFSAAQEVCRNLENQAKCDSAVFVTNPLKIQFSHKLELAIITRTNNNCGISAIVPSLFN